MRENRQIEEIDPSTINVIPLVLWPSRGVSWVTVPTWVWRLWTDSRLWLLTCPCEVQVFAVSDLFLLPPTLARQDPVMLGRCPSRNFSDENWAVFAEEESDRDTRSVMNNQLTDSNVSHWPHESKSEWQLLASGGVSICPYLTVVGRQDRLSHYSQRNWSDQWPPPGRSLYKGWTITPNTYTYIPTYLTTNHFPSSQPSEVCESVLPGSCYHHQFRFVGPQSSVLV